MATHSLPMPPAELARRLSRSLAPRRDGLEISVSDAAVVEAPDGLGLRLRAAVTAFGREKTETWQITVPLDPIDVDPEVDPASFVTTVRANLEEWWAVKGAEPQIAAWGHRLE